MRRIVFTAFVLVFSLSFQTSPSQAQWAATYWGSQIYDIHQAADGGFVTSIGEENGLRLQKLDASGVPLWSKYYYDNLGNRTYRSTLYTYAFRRSPLAVTSDGGYALATLIQQQPNGTYGVGLDDVWFLKLDDTGEIEWQRTYGGADYDSPSDMHQTADGGYILAGRTKSFGQQGVWVVKLDAAGNIEWENVYGGYIATAIRQTNDNGYILTGWTASAGAGGTDIWVLKLDAGGDIEPGMQKTFGGADDDTGYVIRQTADGGYILGGETNSFNVQPGTKACLWILKLDAALNISWQKTYSGTSLLDETFDEVDHEIPQDIIQTTDGHFVVAGSTNHFGHGAQEAWILKLDATGQGAVLWEKTYGGLEVESVFLPPTESSEAFFAVLEALDGSLTAAGATQMGYGELGFVVNLDSEGRIPGCSLMGDSSAVVTDTAVSGQTTQASAQATAAAVLLPPGVARENPARLKEFVCPEGVDLSVRIADTPDPIRPNQPLAYVLTAENLGTVSASSVVVEAVLPAGLSFFSSTATQGSTAESGGVVSFDIGSLPGGESATLSIVARAVAAGTHELTAEITADQIAFDQAAANNTAVETTRVSEWLTATVDEMDWSDLDLSVDSRGYAHLVYTRNNDLRYASNAGGEWLHWTLVDSGAVKNPAIALDGSDKVHIIYGEGPDMETNALKYLHNSAGNWSLPVTLADSAGAAGSTDLAVGTDGSLHLVYLEGGMATSSNLIYMTTRDQDPGEWTAVGLHPEGYDAAALALDSDNRAHVVFYSWEVILGFPGTTQGVGYATNAPDGVWQAVEVVDPNWSGGQMEGMDLDIAVDATGIPHIVFNGDADGEYNEDTRYAARIGGVWVLDEVEDGGFAGAGKSIALDPDGNVYVSYYRTPDGDLRVADNVSGPWRRVTVAGDGWFNAIAVDRWGQAHVGYFDSGSLKYARVQSLPDSDGDGVGDAEEDAAPNGGDANQDGIPDRGQSHVASLETLDGGHRVSLVAPDTTLLSQVRSTGTPYAAGMPEGTDFPFGFFDFTLLGAAIDTGVGVDLRLPDASTASYFKFGPTPANPTDHWYLFDWDGATGSEASGNVITLYLMDGYRGDRDITANGIIQDPGGPAAGPAGLQHILLSPPVLEFGELLVGEYAELDLTVLNVGGADLTVGSITGPHSPFARVSDACSGEILAPDGACVVTLRYEPLSLGEARQVLLIPSDDPAFPSMGATLMGTASPAPLPEIQATPDSLSFGDVNVGSYAELSISVGNIGMETLHIGSIQALPSPFSIIEDQVSNAVIHTGDTARLTVRFEPQSDGPAEEILVIPSDDPDDNLLMVALAGNGVGGPLPDIVVSSRSVDFGEVTVGTEADRSITIENQGDADLVLGALTGLQSPFSLALDACSGQTLAAGTNCVFTVRFAPGSSSQFSDSLSIPSNDPDENPLDISLSGSGAAVGGPVLSLSPEALDFGDQTTQMVFSISNTGTGTLSWEISPALPDWLSFAPMSGDVSNTPAEVTVHVDRDQMMGKGVFSMSVPISSNGGNASILIQATKPNTPPVADAGEDILSGYTAGEPVQLNGSGFDADGDSIVSYRWNWVYDPDTQTNPPAFGAYLSDYTIADPIFTGPYAGEYTLALVVNDGAADSAPDPVVIRLDENPVENQPPIADAGADITGTMGTPIQLDGTGSSDPDGVLTFWQWQWVWDEENGTHPVALGAALSDFHSPAPVFQSPQPGIYTLSLTVTDSRRAVSAADEVVITVTDLELDHLDSDGIEDVREHGPNGDNPQFDGNGDGIPDGIQHHVASFHAHNQAGYITMASEPGSYLTLVSPQGLGAAGGGPGNVDFPLALFDFTINNLDLDDKTTLTYYLPPGIAVDTYYKYGPTPDNPVDHWYEFMWDGETGARISGDTVTLYFVDAKRGDDVLIPDNRIVDLGGPADNTDGGGSGCFIDSVF